ncbi:hypothetical protein C2G38_2042673 [Gigaspora rosea]|uniref:Uncharacterized protein n=1 Tax=Gigaspora rosea TaxID=44941 RepID=A0A397UPI3_9GLOM|nr:hypothetical protein C2G38_2042673 [Gigaspora rosea]
MYQFHQKEEPSNGRLLRETKKICYAKSSSSDLEDVEESKNATSNSLSATNTSIASTNIVHSATNALIMIPNKPIITKATYDKYSAHIICAFNTTIHLVKETVEKPGYEKVRNMLQMGNKLVMNDLIVKILKNIFRESYSEIESKIISETNIKDNPTMEENRFIYFIRCALLDFVFIFRYLMPKVLDRDMLERSYIVACLSQILRAFRNAFSDVKYMWLEKDIRSIKEANLMFTIIRNEFLEQEKLQRKIRVFIPTNNCSEILREWLHLPNDDISLVIEENMDEIFL